MTNIIKEQKKNTALKKLRAYNKPCQLDVRVKTLSKQKGVNKPRSCDNTRQLSVKALIINKPKASTVKPHFVMRVSKLL